MAVSLQAETCLLHSVPISWATATVCLSTKDSCFFFYHNHLLDFYTWKMVSRSPKIQVWPDNRNDILIFLHAAHLFLCDSICIYLRDCQNLPTRYFMFLSKASLVIMMVFCIRTWSLTECWIPHMSYRVSRWFLSHHYTLIHFVVKVRELAVAL